MTKFIKTSLYIGVFGVFSLGLSGCHLPNQSGFHKKTNHIHGHNINHKSGFFTRNRYNNVKQAGYNQAYKGPYSHPARPQYYTNQHGKKYSGLAARLRGKKNINYQIPAPVPGPRDAFQRWVDYEPLYTMYPGDQIDIRVASAPELSQTLTVGPDGRISMPLIKPILAAGRSTPQVQAALTAQLSTQLRDPSVAVTPRAFAPAQIFVLGSVGQPGIYTIPGPIGVIEALAMSGGPAPGARVKEIAVLRRAPNGGMMLRTVNLKNGLNNIREYNDNVQLRRGDIVYIPRTTIAEAGDFVQAIRRAIPIDANVSYTIGNFGGNNNAVPAVTTPVIP